jgi:hypothetical protein
MSRINAELRDIIAVLIMVPQQAVVYLLSGGTIAPQAGRLLICLTPLLQPHFKMPDHEPS